MFIETTIADFPTTELGLLHTAFGSSSDDSSGLEEALVSDASSSPNGAHWHGVAIDDDPTEPLAVTVLNVGREPDAAAPLGELTIGGILRSRYVLDDVVGQGGDAIVFRARDLHRASLQGNGSPCVAIKALLPEKRHDPRTLKRLQREFRQMQLLIHPGIARQYDLDCDGDIWFICMELIEGVTTSAWLQQPRSMDQALTLIGSCCAALDHAHSLGIIHGDLKPANVLVVEDEKVKLIDFGCAPDTRLCTAVEESSAAATASYASPEVLTGNSAEVRDDVFSLACLSYVILSQGRHPFDSGTSLAAYRTGRLPEMIPGVPSRLHQALMRGLSPERAQRTESASEFYRQLVGVDSAAPAGDSSGSPVAVPQRTTDEPVVAAQDKPAPAPGSNAVVRASLTPTLFSAAQRSDLASSCSSGTALVNVPRLNACMASPQPGLTRTLWVALRRARGFGSRGRMATRGAAVAAFAMVAVGVLALLQHGREVTADATVAASAAVTSSKPAVSTAPIVITPAAAQPPEPSRAVTEVTRKVPASGRITFNSNTIYTVAGQSLLAIPVKRLAPVQEPAVVAWAIEDRNPSRGSARRAKQNLVRFIEGQATRSIFIPLAGDSTLAGSYGTGTFTVVLRKVSGGPALGPVSRIRVSRTPPHDTRLASEAP